MKQIDKHIQEFTKMSGNMIGADVYVVKISKPNRADATKEMINDTFQIIKQIKNKPLTQEAIDQAVHLLNTRPRKRHNWRTPKEMLGI